MGVLYPLKFKPVFREKLWGGSRIKEHLNMTEAPSVQCGEAWMLSGVPENDSVVTNGNFEGNTINELVEIYMGELVGDQLFYEYGELFPVLIKFIDANDWLSIQVHPDDELAEKRHDSFGKKEMWYVLEAEKDSQLISGFKKELTKADYVESIKDGNLKELLNYEYVSPGDVFYIPSGRVHALGPGILLAEIQQTSDITYRIHDWDRLDSAGMPRELHTEQSIEAINFSVPDNYKTEYEAELNKSKELVSCDKFTTNLVQLDRAMKKDYSHLDSFVSYVCVEGNMTIVDDDNEHVNIKKGETVLIPNKITGVEIYPQPAVKFLEVYVK